MYRDLHWWDLEVSYDFMLEKWINYRLDDNCTFHEFLVRPFHVRQGFEFLVLPEKLQEIRIMDEELELYDA